MGGSGDWKEPWMNALKIYLILVSLLFLLVLKVSYAPDSEMSDEVVDVGKVERVKEMMSSQLSQFVIDQLPKQSTSISVSERFLQMVDAHANLLTGPEFQTLLSRIIICDFFNLGYDPFHNFFSREAQRKLIETEDFFAHEFTSETKVACFSKLINFVELTMGAVNSIFLALSRPAYFDVYEPMVIRAMEKGITANMILGFDAALFLTDPSDLNRLIDFSVKMKERGFDLGRPYTASEISMEVEARSPLAGIYVTNTLDSFLEKQGKGRYSTDRILEQFFLVLDRAIVGLQLPITEQQVLYAKIFIGAEDYRINDFLSDSARRLLRDAAFNESIFDSNDFKDQCELGCARRILNFGKDAFVGVLEVIYLEFFRITHKNTDMRERGLVTDTEDTPKERFAASLFTIFQEAFKEVGITTQMEAAAENAQQEFSLEKKKRGSRKGVPQIAAAVLGSDSRAKTARMLRTTLLNVERREELIEIILKGKANEREAARLELNAFDALMAARRIEAERRAVKKR